MDFKILIIDSHPLTRAGISSILAHHQLAGAVSTFEEAQAILERARPDLAVIDDPWICPKLAAEVPGLMIIVCSEVVPARLPEGARAVISKRADPAALVQLVDRALRGDATAAFTPTTIGPDAILSPREHQVMSMMLAGRRQKEIALDLEISVKTVSTHRFRLLRKLGLESDLALMRFALANGFA